MRFLLDENLSPQQAEVLREQGHDAVAVSDAGLSGQPDSRIRAFAIEDNRVLITLDADFANVLRFPPAGTPGVIRLKIHPPKGRRLSTPAIFGVRFPSAFGGSKPTRGTSLIDSV